MDALYCYSSIIVVPNQIWFVTRRGYMVLGSIVGSDCYAWPLTPGNSHAGNLAMQSIYRILLALLVNSQQRCHVL